MNHYGSRCEFNLLWFFHARMLATEPETGFISVWEITSNQELTFLEKFKPHKRTPRGLAFSPDNRMLVTVSSSGGGFLWDTEDWIPDPIPRGHSRGMHGVNFSPDSRRLLTSGNDQDAVKLWDTDTYQEVVTLGGEGTIFTNPAILEDDRKVVAVSWNNGSNPALHVWRAPTWEEIETAEAAKAQWAASR